MERAASAQARIAALPRNTHDTICPEFSAGILLREKLADKQKSSSLTARKRILRGSRELRSQSLSEDWRNKEDCACNEKARQLRALRNVERCRARLRCANKPPPKCAVPRLEI